MNLVKFYKNRNIVFITFFKYFLIFKKNENLMESIWFLVILEQFLIYFIEIEYL